MKKQKGREASMGLANKQEGRSLWIAFQLSFIIQIELHLLCNLLHAEVKLNSSRKLIDSYSFLIYRTNFPFPSGLVK
jgi:predicted RNA-binding protein YlxR (DUF448 family)